MGDREVAVVERIGDAQRRARLVARHHLAGTAPDVASAVSCTVAMHATDPQTPYLGVRARLADPTATVGDLDHALYEDRALWRLHTIRRTIFVAMLDDAAVLHAAATRDVLRRERRKIHGWLVDALPAGTDVDAWERSLRTDVVAVLRTHGPQRTTELHASVPATTTQITQGSGRWTRPSPAGSHLLFLWAMDGHVVRTRPTGSWRNSQYRWAASDRWFATSPLRPELDEADARTALARRYLATHGPVTERDLAWWTGWTLTRTRAALAAAGAVTVALDDGGTGYVLADDVACGREDPEPHVALLPGLDPTPMGFKDRDWYLGSEFVTRLWDSNGNVGPTVWVDGRIVGGWAVRDDGEVVHRLLVDVGAEAADRVTTAAAELTGWLAGEGVRPRFRTPLERELTV